MGNVQKTFLKFKGAKLYFFPDLSRCTLELHKTLRPLLDILCNAGATYRWGFPFRLTATMKESQPHFMIKMTYLSSWRHLIYPMWTFLTGEEADPPPSPLQDVTGKNQVERG